MEICSRRINLQEMEIVFPGGKRIDAVFDGKRVSTDQAPDNGGEGKEPTPYQVFLAALATCTGIYVLNFCEARKIPTKGLKLIQRIDRDEKTRRLNLVETEVVLPAGFPEKYEKAVLRAAGLCSVKKAFLDPPEFTFKATRG
jgi:putative redox protein